MSNQTPLNKRQQGVLAKIAAAPTMDLNKICDELHLKVDRVRAWMADERFAAALRGARFARREELCWKIQTAAERALAELELIASTAPEAEKSDPTRETRRKACTDFLKLATYLIDGRLGARLRDQSGPAKPYSDIDRMHAAARAAVAASGFTLRNPPADGAD